MTSFGHIWFADILTHGTAGLALCVVVYLAWLLYVEERRKRRKDAKTRKQQRVAHWGHE